MGTSINCAQCHDHKYDPIPQKDFFRFFAILNNTEDADRPDEEPTLKFYSPQQDEQRAKLDAEIAALDKKMKTPTAAQLTAQAAWEKKFPLDLKWSALSAEKTDAAKTPGAHLLAFPADVKRVGAIRVQSIPFEAPKGAKPADTSIVATQISATLIPAVNSSPEGRFVRIELPGKGVLLALAEVQVFSGKENVALKGTATQISTDFGGEAKRAIDGNTEGDYFKANSVTHTAASDDPWWEVDLKAPHKIDNIMIWNRTDGGTGGRLANLKVILLDDKRKEVWRSEIKDPPSPSKSLETGGVRVIPLVAAHADSEHTGFDAEAVVRGAAAEPKKSKNKKNAKMDKPGWSVNFADGKVHSLTLVPAAPFDIPAGRKLEINIVPATQKTLKGKTAIQRFDDRRFARRRTLPHARRHCSGAGNFR